MPEDFDDTKNYRVRLESMEEKDSTIPKAKSKTYLVWHLSAHDIDDNTPVFDDNGDMADIWATSPLDTWRNETSGERAKAREYTDAFLGHESTDEEIDEMIDEGFERRLVGKTAIASFEIQKTSQGYERLGVLKLRPDRKRAAAVGAASAEGRPTRQRRIDDDD